MQLRLHLLTAALLPLAAAPVLATVLCVDVNSTNPAPPYTNWIRAATSIQDAVDEAITGDQILVTNGIYRTGMRASSDGATNRVTVTNAITLRSVNGPAVTVVDGAKQLRCVCLSDGASLAGFTLRNGSASYGGGVRCIAGSSIVSNCIVAGNFGVQAGGGAAGGTLLNCTITNNSTAYSGGGVWVATLSNCTVAGNSSWSSGGGVTSGTLNNCILSSNTCTAGYGGGAYQGTLNNCTLIGNAAGAGGGAYWGTLNRCSVIGNSASEGGGAYSGYLNNCLLAGNSALLNGDGAYYGDLTNCTLVGNSSADWGGGALVCLLYNCVVYNNSAPTGPNYGPNDPTTPNFCCTFPMPAGGVGNFTNEPLFIDWAGGNLRLQSNSPCINAEQNAYVFGATDLDGRPRIVAGTVDVGAYEFQPGASGTFIGWLQQRGLPTDGSADYADADADGLNNWQEWIASTDPTNAASVLAMHVPMVTGSNSVLSWRSVSNRTYFLQRCTSLAATPVFSTIGSNIAGQATTTTFTDTEANGAGPYMYRVGVQQ